ncbi:MAG: hypothetical protein ACE5JM_03830 [Armatimonadota bacterium]
MARRREDVEFVCARSLPRSTRLKMIAGFAGFGVVLQCLVLLFVPAPSVIAQVAYALVGWPFLLVAMLLALVRGGSNRPRGRGPRQWEKVTVEEFERVVEIEAQTQRFKSKLGPMSLVSCAGGCALAGALALVVGVCAFVFLVSPESQPLAITLGIDALTLVIPMWLCGLTVPWQPQELLMKVKALLNVYHHVTMVPDPQISISPMLEVRKATGGKMPTDARMLIRWKSAPEGFIGVQVQVSINKVQSSKYPYLYCVLLARGGFPLHERVKPLLAPPERPSGLKRFLGGGSAQEKKEARFSTYRGEVAELTQEKDVEIVVLRQKAVGTGYHTQAWAQRRVLQNAMSLARAVLGVRQAAPPAPSRLIPDPPRTA